MIEHSKIRISLCNFFSSVFDGRNNVLSFWFSTLRQIPQKIGKLFQCVCLGDIHAQPGTTVQLTWESTSASASVAAAVVSEFAFENKEKKILRKKIFFLHLTLSACRCLTLKEMKKISQLGKKKWICRRRRRRWPGILGKSRGGWNNRRRHRPQQRKKGIQNFPDINLRETWEMCAQIHSNVVPGCYYLFGDVTEFQIFLKKIFWLLILKRESGKEREREIERERERERERIKQTVKKRKN